MNVINLLLGFVILLTGRQLFWLFVGALGFLAGAALAQQYIQADPAWLVWIIALGAGFVGALLAVFLQRFAVSIAGFIGGWYLMSTLASTYGWGFGNADWVIFLIGGIVGSVLVSALYDWALIFLSSIAGAITIVQNLDLNLVPVITTLVLLALIVTGIAVQSRVMHRETPKPEPKKEKGETGD